MTVKQLKELLNNYSDDTNIYVMTSDLDILRPDNDLY